MDLESSRGLRLGQSVEHPARPPGCVADKPSVLSRPSLTNDPAERKAGRKRVQDPHNVQWGDDPSRPLRLTGRPKSEPPTLRPGAGRHNSRLGQCPGDGESPEDSSLDLAFPGSGARAPWGLSEAESSSIVDTPPAIFLEIHCIH